MDDSWCYIIKSTVIANKLTHNHKGLGFVAGRLLRHTAFGRLPRNDVHLIDYFFHLIEQPIALVSFIFTSCPAFSEAMASCT